MAGVEPDYSGRVRPILAIFHCGFVVVAGLGGGRVSFIIKLSRGGVSSASRTHFEKGPRLVPRALSYLEKIGWGVLKVIFSGPRSTAAECPGGSFDSPERGSKGPRVRSGLGLMVRPGRTGTSIFLWQRPTE